jgi:thiamine monophosphate synthase
MSSYSAEDLAAIEKAIKSGVTKVKFRDREVEYRSLAELKQIRDDMLKDLGRVPKTQRVFASFKKGTS